MVIFLKNLRAYRGFILGGVKREFQMEYLKSMLDTAWAVINPLAMIVVYTVIFSQIMRMRLPCAESNIRNIRTHSVRFMPKNVPFLKPKALLRMLIAGGWSFLRHERGALTML